MATAKLTGLISLMAVIGVGQALGQGTDAQREACTPDAFRLCMSAMPDAGRVEGCLRSNGPRLSAGCYAVFNPPQDVQTTGALRTRSQRELQQRDVQQRELQQRDRDDQRLDRRSRDDGFGGFQQRDYQPRPQPQYDDE